MAATTESFLKTGALESYMPSDSDDESFVVLSKSMPSESIVEIQKSDCEAVSIDPITTSINSASQAIEQLTISTAVSEPLLSLPRASQYNEINAQQITCPDTTQTSVSSDVSDLNPTEIQHKIDMLIEENTKLKDTLLQNNLAMRRQYDVIAMWNQDVQKVHEDHKKKFSETKQYIDKLKSENIQVKAELQSSKKTISTLLDEISILKSADSNIKVLNQELYKTTFDNLKKFEVETADKKILELEEKLSKLEINNKDQDDDINNLKKELQDARSENEKLKEELQHEFKSSVMKQSKLIDEIDSLKSTLSQKSEVDIESISQLREQLTASQIQITDLLEERRKDQEFIRQKEAELTDFKQGLRSLESRVVDPTVIAEKDLKITNLQKEVSNLKDEVELIPILKQQLEVYKSDFEAERHAKNEMKIAKDEIADDLGNLQRRNQQLIDEVNDLRVAAGVVPPSSSSQEPKSDASAPPQQSPQSIRFRCPMCLESFRTLRFLEDHIDICLLNGN